MLADRTTVADAGVDAVALKPSECRILRATELPVGTIAIDYEGREHLPERDTIAELTEDADVYITTPVRADGFDPLGDDSLLDRVPGCARRVLVAGHPAYLTEEERRRAIAPRLGAATEDATDPWIGTEGIERIALAAGGGQYELLSRTTERDLRALRAAGFDGEIAVYAPTVLTDDADEILDAVGEYVARRRIVREALPDGARVDATATGRAREVLLSAAADFALGGDPPEVRERVGALKEAGATTVVAYPTRGIEELL